jgi:hypothetical protein
VKLSDLGTGLISERSQRRMPECSRLKGVLVNMIKLVNKADDD